MGMINRSLDQIVVKPCSSHKVTCNFSILDMLNDLDILAMNLSGDCC